MGPDGKQYTFRVTGKDTLGFEDLGEEAAVEIAKDIEYV